MTTFKKWHFFNSCTKLQWVSKKNWKKGTKWTQIPPFQGDESVVEPGRRFQNGKNGNSFVSAPKNFVFLTENLPKCEKSSKKV